MNRAFPYLTRTAWWASATGLLYGVTLTGTAWPRETSAIWLPTTRAWTEPALLLFLQIAALAGLIGLVFVLRGVARTLARQAAAPRTPGAGPRFTPFPVTPMVAGPLAAVVAPALGILLAARGSLTPMGLLLLSTGLPALVMAVTLGRPRPSTRLVRKPDSLDAQVSRLRGASLLVTAVGGGFFFVSGSLVLAALLPWAVLREVPRSPVPMVEPLRVAYAPGTPSEMAGGGGGGPGGEDGAAQAGQAIHALFFAGSPKAPGPREKTPVRSYRPWWQEVVPRPLGLPPHEWAGNLAGALATGTVSEEDRDFLSGLADHPANGEFDLLEGVEAADVTGERLAALDVPIAVFEVPIPRYVELWNGVRGRLAGALWLAHRGQAAEARRRIDTVGRLGTLLYQDGPATLDAVLGRRIVAEADRASASLDVAAQTDRSTVGGTHTAEGRRQSDEPPSGVLETLAVRKRWLASHSGVLEDTSAPRGIRFEAFAMVQSFRPCRSLAAVLWGRATWDDPWSRGRRKSLATRPSESILTQVYAHGWLGTRAGVDGWGWLPRVLVVPLSDRPAVTHCAPLAATLLSRG